MLQLVAAFLGIWIITIMLNNVYVDGKKISEYTFKDPRLNKYLKHRMDMKKKCSKLKAMKIKQDGGK